MPKAMKLAKAKSTSVDALVAQSQKLGQQIDALREQRKALKAQIDAQLPVVAPSPTGAVAYVVPDA